MTMPAEKTNTIIQWLRTKDTVWDVRMCADGELDVLKCLRNLDCPWDETTCENAEKGGHLEVLRRAHANGCPWHMVKTTNGEVQRFERGMTEREWALEVIPGHPNHLVNSHILRSYTDPIFLARLRAVSPAMRDAVDKTGILVEGMTPARAAELGCLDTLKHILQTGSFNHLQSQWAVCANAARGRHLEMLQWLCANGCPWNWHECKEEARRR